MANSVRPGRSRLRTLSSLLKKTPLHPQWLMPKSALPPSLATPPNPNRARLLVLASTFPRWKNDHEPAFVYELARRLLAEFDVTVLCPHAPGARTEETMDSVEVRRFRYAPSHLETLVNNGGVVTNLRRARWKILLVPGFVLSQLWMAWRLCRAGKIDLIHAHWIIPQGLIALLAVSASGRNIPVVVTSHGADLYALRSSPLNWLKKQVVRRAAAVTVVSDAMREPLLALADGPVKLHVESMGVDLATRFSVDPAVQRSENDILFVGRLVEKKGLRHLIDAMPRILAARPLTRLVIVGYGPELAARRAQVVNLGIASAVEFVGAVEQAQLGDYYRRAAVLAAPFVAAVDGDREGLGLVCIEALGCGCPVVVSEMPATRMFSRLSPAVTTTTSVASEPLALALVDALAARREVVPDDVAMFDWPMRAAAYIRILNATLGRV